MNTDNILNTNDVLVGNPVSLKQTDDKKIFAILNESTGEVTVGFDDDYEAELVKDLQLLESITERINKKKTEIKDFIETNKFGSFKTAKVQVKYTSATTTTTIDTKLLKSEYPDIAAKCSRVGSKASSISVSIKNKE